MKKSDFKFQRKQKGASLKLWFHILWTMCFSGFPPHLRADEPHYHPQEVDAKLFTALKTASPFSRTLNIPGSHSLLAVAIVDGIGYARVYNKDTKETITIQTGRKSQNGLELIEVDTPGYLGDLSSVVARISFGGEIGNLRYSPEQLSPEKHPARKKDSDRRVVGSMSSPKESQSMDRENYEKLSDQDKEKLKDFIKAEVTKSPRMSHEARIKLMRSAITKLTEGRDLSIQN